MERLTHWLRTACCCMLLYAAAATTRKVLEGAGATTSARPHFLLSAYLNNSQLESHIVGYVQRCGHIARHWAYGRSGRGQPLMAIALTDRSQSQPQPAPSDRPHFRYVANIHGDEPSGRQLLLMLAEHLCHAYKQDDPAAVRLLRSLVLVLVPSANPDGFDAMHRGNAVGIDVNRDFPDPINNTVGAMRAGLGTEQPETKALMALALSRHFVAGANLHEGAVVASYPMDGYPDGSLDVRNRKQPAPDDATFVHLASTYARLHTSMSTSSEFPGGITNGAQWYPLYGGFQDWMYLVGGCMEITLELWNSKAPPAQLLPALWQQNKRALLEYPALAVFGGVHGAVAASDSGHPVTAVVRVAGLPMQTHTGPSGRFARPLAPGPHWLQVSANGYLTTTVQVVVLPLGQGPGLLGGANVTIALQRAATGHHPGGGGGGGGAAAAGGGHAGGAAGAGSRSAASGRSSSVKGSDRAARDEARGGASGPAPYSAAARLRSARPRRGEAPWSTWSGVLRLVAGVVALQLLAIALYAWSVRWGRSASRGGGAPAGGAATGWALSVIGQGGKTSSPKRV